MFNVGDQVEYIGKDKWFLNLKYGVVAEKDPSFVYHGRIPVCFNDFNYDYFDGVKDHHTIIPEYLKLLKSRKPDWEV